MANAINILGQQLKEIWYHFGVNQKVSTVLALLLTIGLIGGMLYWSSRPSYRLLYSGMSLKDASTAREKLQDEHIPVQLKDSGRSLYVPSKEVYRSRLLLAKEGLPEDNATGFELFEQPKFGLTDFAQKVNYQRALQGELERTINAMAGVRSCRIMLVLPKEKLFASEAEKRASASIMLTMASSEAPSASQVRSIRQFVAAGVPGLVATGITVTDQYGRTLSKSADSSQSGLQATGDQIEVQEKLESVLTKKAQEMLDRALGMGRSIVRVSALLDFSETDKTKETYDAESRVVISETISTESTTDPVGSGGGRVGVMANVPVGAPDQVNVEESMSRSKKEDISTEYKVPSAVERVVSKGVTIERISVSVCVAQKEEQRTSAELKSIENIVRSAVGFTESASRKDYIQVEEIKFPEAATPAALAWWQRLPISLDALGTGVGGVILLVIIMVVSRRMIGGLSIEKSDVGVPVAVLPGMGGASAQIGGGMSGATMDGKPDIEYVARLAEQDPNSVAAWIMNATKSGQ